MKMLLSLLIGIILLSGIYYVYIQTGGKGDLTSKTYEVSGFDGIDVGTYADVNISQSDTESVSISGYQKNIDNTDVKVQDNTLIISGKDKFVFWFWISKNKMTIDIKLKDLNRINFSGAGNINTDKLILSDLEYILNGSGKANFNNLSVDSMKTTINGSGNIYASGTASKTEMTINGSGKIDFSKFTTENARATIVGSGSIKVDAIKNLVAGINGSGEVLYVGDPFITENIMGSGKIEQIK